jgi:hypothetical protein
MIGIAARTIVESGTRRLMTFETLGEASASPALADAHAKQLGTLFTDSFVASGGSFESSTERELYGACRVEELYSDPDTLATRRVAYFGNSGEHIGAASLMTPFEAETSRRASIIEITTVDGQIAGKQEKLAAGLLYLAASDAIKDGSLLMVDTEQDCPDLNWFETVRLQPEFVHDMTLQSGREISYFHLTPHFVQLALNRAYPELRNLNS